MVSALSFQAADDWLKRLVIERKSDDDAPLASTFAGVIEAYVAKPKLASIGASGGWFSAV